MKQDTKAGSEQACPSGEVKPDGNFVDPHRLFSRRGFPLAPRPGDPALDSGVKHLPAHA